MSDNIPVQQQDIMGSGDTNMNNLKNDRVESDPNQVQNLIPILNRKSKHSILEQALLVSDGNNHPVKCFSKFLLQNHTFIDIARNDSVYSFCMIVRATNTILGFSNHRNILVRGFGLNLNRAMRLILFLNPNQFVVRIKLNGSQDSSYLYLLPLTKGAITMAMHENLESASALTRTYWDRFDRLLCPASALVYLPPNNFKMLSVNVRTFREMSLALQHNSDQLKLVVDRNFEDVGQAPANVGEIRACQLHPHRSAALKSIRALLRSCPSLKKLHVETYFLTHRAHLISIDELFVYFIDLHDIYVNAARVLSVTEIDVTVKVYADVSGTNFTLPINWLRTFLLQDAIPRVKTGTKVDGNDVTTTFTSEQHFNNVKAEFRFQVRYSYAR